jgi:chromosome segregation ATPase
VSSDPEIDRRLAALQELIEAKLAALQSALEAARENGTQRNTAYQIAASKAEANTAKQIDQITALIGALDKATADRIGELKERIDRREGTLSGLQAERTERRLSFGQVVATVGVMLVALGIIVSTLVALLRH